MNNYMIGVYYLALILKLKNLELVGDFISFEYGGYYYTKKYDDWLYNLRAYNGPMYVSYCNKGGK